MPESRATRLKEKSGRPLSGTAPRLYQRVFDILAGQIEDGAISPSTRLHESGVAAQFGISRAPARQALLELERGSFVEKAAGCGYAVRADAITSPAASNMRFAADDAYRLVSSSSWERI